MDGGASVTDEQTQPKSAGPVRLARAGTAFVQVVVDQGAPGLRWTAWPPETLFATAPAAPAIGAGGWTMRGLILIVPLVFGGVASAQTAEATLNPIAVIEAASESVAPPGTTFRFPWWAASACPWAAA